MISASEDLLYYGNSAEQSSSVFPCFKGKLQKLEDDTPLRRPCKNLQSLCGIVITEDSPDKKSTFVKVQDESEMLTEMVDEGGRGLTNGTVYVGAKVLCPIKTFRSLLLNLTQNSKSQSAIVCEKTFYF
jgi:hypothetical protein